jgi:hypothetical protein
MEAAEENFRKYVENKMSEALVRHCPGCNKIGVKVSVCKEKLFIKYILEIYLLFVE